MSVAQIGEFSFIIASLGVTLKVTSSFLYPIAVAVSAITTLLTPYLIRAADPFTNTLEQLAPRGLTNMLDLYTRWIGEKSDRRANDFARTLMWKWGAQMALNVVLIAAVFSAAAYCAEHPPAWLSALALKPQWLGTSVWLVAAICSLPLIIAIARKLQSLGLLLAETKVSPERAGEHTAAIRSVIARLVPLIGSVALGVFVLLLSSTLLPPVKVLLVLLVVIGLIAALMWRPFIKVHSTAQAALQDTFAKSAVLPSPQAELPPAPLLSEANLESVPVPLNAAVAGKLIRELALRTQTGASVVCIERQNARLLNPGPDEEILVGDKVLLLGSPEQLTAAKQVLLNPEKENGPGVE
jgi:CPA2 family monovalent cation:H+ antiporter-2